MISYVVQIACSWGRNSSAQYQKTKISNKSYGYYIIVWFNYAGFRLQGILEKTIKYSYI